MFLSHIHPAKVKLIGNGLNLISTVFQLARIPKHCSRCSFKIVRESEDCNPKEKNSLKNLFRVILNASKSRLTA